MLKYSLDRYKTQEIRDKFCLLALKFAPNWFLKNKCLNKLIFLFSNDDIVMLDLWLGLLNINNARHVKWRQAKN